MSNASGVGRLRNYVVIGAGVIGAALAAELAGRGVPVTLLDRDVPGRATTGSSFAWYNANTKTPRSYYDRNVAGMRAWAELAVKLDGAAWFRPSGNLEWTVTAEDHAELAERVRRLAAWGYSAEWVTRAAVATLEPAIRPPESVAGFAWFAGEGYLLTEPLVDRLVARSVQCGAIVHVGKPGRAVAVQASGGTVRAVRTADGTEIPADVVVCCAGRWTPEIVAQTGAPARLPLVPWQSAGAEAPGLVVRVGPVAEPVPRRMVHTPEVVLRPHPDRLVQLENPGLRVDLRTPEIVLRDRARELLARGRRLAPGLATAEVVDYRVCVRPIPLDGHPIAGWLPGIGGAYALVTHSGVTLAAHLARLVADELVDGVRVAELAPYRPDRFG